MSQTLTRLAVSMRKQHRSRPPLPLVLAMVVAAIAWWPLLSWMRGAPVWFW